MGHELCTFPSVLSVKRSSVNKGFHRDVISEIHVDFTELMDKFSLLLIEHFPPDIYIDTYQLLHEQKTGSPKVVVYQEVNVETPASKSSSFDAFLFLNSEDEWSRIVLPVHLRYQKPQMCSQQGAFKNISFKNPSIFIQWFENNAVFCENMLSGPCDLHSKQNCSWIPLNVSYATDELLLEVPVGCLEHYPVVSLVTVLTMICGIAALLYVLIFDKLLHKIKRE